MKLLLLNALLLLLPIASSAQGKLPLNEKKEVKGVLCFLPSPSLTKGFATVSSPFPAKTDPAADPETWHSGTGAWVRGIMKEAVLYLNWWVLAGEPVERYQFKWISTGWFEVNYHDAKGASRTRRISRQDLANYPDLQKSFDNIAPENVDVEIEYTVGDVPGQVYADFRRKYNILTSLGAAGYKADFKRYVSGSGWLFERSNKDVPFMVPGSVSWKEFTGTEWNDKTKRMIELMSSSSSVEIRKFRIASIKWPIGSFVYIAKQLDKYEGLEKDTDPETLANEAPLPKPANLTDDFWNEPEFVDADVESYKDGHYYGLKSRKGKILIPAAYPYNEAFVPTKKKGVFLANVAHEGMEEVRVVSAKQGVITSLPYPEKIEWRFIDHDDGRESTATGYKVKERSVGERGYWYSPIVKVHGDFVLMHTFRIQEEGLGCPHLGQYSSSDLHHIFYEVYKLGDNGFRKTGKTVVEVLPGSRGSIRSQYNESTKQREPYYLPCDREWKAKKLQQHKSKGHVEYDEFLDSTFTYD